MLASAALRVQTRADINFEGGEKIGFTRDDSAFRELLRRHGRMHRGMADGIMTVTKDEVFHSI